MKIMKIRKKHSEIWNRTNDLIEKDFDVETIHDDKYILTIIRSYKNEIKSGFYYDRLPPEKCWLHNPCENS